ncbi:vacuolar import/degradation protein Vid24, partial [Kipferlia bialata]
TFSALEVIDESKFHFITHKYQTDFAVDKDMWSRFDSFAQYTSTFHTRAFSKEYSETVTGSNIRFFRLKELSLHPTAQHLEGCSFDGVYYMKLDLDTGQGEGFYFRGSRNSAADPPKVSFTFSPVRRYCMSPQAELSAYEATCGYVTDEFM